MFVVVFFFFALFGGTSHCLNFEKFCDAALFSNDIRVRETSRLVPFLDERPFCVLKWQFPAPFCTNVPQRLKSGKGVALLGRVACSRLQDSGWSLHTP